MEDWNHLHRASFNCPGWRVYIVTGNLPLVAGFTWDNNFYTHLIWSRFEGTKVTVYGKFFIFELLTLLRMAKLQKNNLINGKKKTYLGKRLSRNPKL